MDAPARSAGERPAPIPLTVLTGFLGAGKTTLLNRLLADPDLADTVVIINEFGEIGLDHLLVEAVEDGLVLLQAGCVCCSVRGDLVRTLEDLLRRRDNGRIGPFRRVVIETTGLADPGPVLAAILYHPYLSQRYGLEGVVALVPALGGEAALDRHPEALRQAAMADRLVVTKGDLASAAERDALRARLAGLNPNATLVEAVSGDLPAASVIGSGLFSVEAKGPEVSAWIAGAAHAHEHRHAHDPNRHDSRIRAVALTSESPLPVGALDMFLDLIRSTYGAQILRMKGLVAVATDPDRPLVIQGVAHVLHVPAMLPAWPDSDRRSRLVVILEDADPAGIVRLWDAFTGRPAIDAPDAAALTDNPLAPATLMRMG